MAIQHKDILSNNTHEPRHISSASTSDAGKVITPSSNTAGTSVLRSLEMEDIDLSGSKSVFTYWYRYVDGQFTQGSPKTVSASTKYKVTIDNLRTGPNAPLGGTGSVLGVELWDTVNNEITPENGLDVLMATLNFKCSTSGSDLYLDLEVDAGGTYKQVEKTLVIPKGSGDTNNFSVDFPVYATGEYSANNPEIFITPASSTDFWDFDLYLTRVHKGSTN